MRVCVLVLGVMLFMVSQAWAMGSLQPSTKSEDHGSLIGKQAPDLVLEDNTSQRANVVGSRNGSKAIMIFWATWCPHCHEELARLQTMLPTLEQKGIKVIMVDLGETKEEVNAYFERINFPLKSFVDEENALQDPYKLDGVPTVVLINAQGIIRAIDYQIPENYDELLNS